MNIVNRHMNKGLKIVFEPIITTDIKSINHIIKPFLSVGVVFLLAFLINKNGVIEWKQFDTNYKKRASVKDILKAIEENNL